MRKRVEIKKPECLETYLNVTDHSEDFKALVLRMVVQMGDVQKVAELTGVPRSTIYHWIEGWNRQEDLSNRRGQGGGGKPRLSAEQQAELKELLAAEECWTLKEVKALIEQTFGVTYSESHLGRLLRNMGLKCVKPYMMDYRRPENAEQILRGRVRIVFEKLRAQGIREEEVAVGFVDETSPQNTANSVRVWSFGKPRIKKNTERMRANAAGFYALKGHDVMEFMERSRAMDVCEFLRKVKEANQEYRVIVVIWDNFASHRSKQVQAEAEKLGIHLVYLPPYSPDLNPIEQIWRVIRRELSTLLVKNVKQMQEIIRAHFERLVQRLTFCRAWITSFFNHAWNAAFCSN